MRPALGIDTNKKIQLKLSEDAGAASYTCLVKKVKENLVALVISNRDKHNVNPPVGARLFLLNEWGDDYWITPTELIQNQSFPLIILKVIEEPYSVTEGPKGPPPAPIDEIESITDDHSSIDEEVKAPEDISEEPVIIPAGQEAGRSTTPIESYEKSWRHATASDVTDDPDPQEDEIGIDDQVEEKLEDLENDPVNAEVEETYQMEPMDGDGEETHIIEEETLDEIVEVENAEGSAIDSSDEDIFGNPDDMAIIADNNIDISDLLDDETESADQNLGTDDQGSEPDAASDAYIVDEKPSEDRYEADSQERFKDNFVVFLTPIDSSMVENVMESIKVPEKKAFEQSQVAKNYSVDLPEGLDPSARDIMATLSSHILNIEKTMEELKTNISSPFFNPLGNQISAICLSISGQGVDVVIDDLVSEGKNFLILVDRPWNPALKFSATAVVDSVENLHGVKVAKMSFTAIQPQSVACINNYLTEGAQYFKIIEKFRLA